MKKEYGIALVLIAQIAIIQMFSYFPKSIEIYYSKLLYPFIVLISRTIFSVFPFSIGDVFYILAISLAFYYSIKKRKLVFQSWKKTLFKGILLFSIVFFLFNFLWGLNYYRVPLKEKMNLDQKYTEAEFLAFTKKLILKTNQIHAQIEPSAQNKIVMPYSQEEIFKSNVEGYQTLAKSYPDFTYTHLSVKKSMLSTPLSYMGFSGYLNPFTNEAQVNSKVPLYGLPLICNHEMAHQLGYAAEGEANFIGFMASIRNSDDYIQYSGYSFALRYCIFYWKEHHKELYLTLKSQIRPGILANFEENKQFWLKHETFITEGFEWFYDRFLKLNQQKDGMDGYSKFVDLMVNYETKYGTICK